MNRLITGVLLVVLSCVPSFAQAESTRGPQVLAGETVGIGLAQSGPGSASDYAAREVAAPQLAEFEGGGGGIYIGTGALVVGLIVLIIILVVH